MRRTEEIKVKISEIANQPLGKHGEIFSEINDALAEQLREIESA
jgi:hypothetical protein